MKLKKHILDFTKTCKYFVDHINAGKTLCNMVVDETDFKEGVFYTYLPEDAKTSRLYQYSSGGIIPNIILEGKVYHTAEGKPYHPELFQSTINETSSFIRSFLKKNKNSKLVVDNYYESINSKFVHIENVDLFIFSDEVYYILDEKNSVSEITEAVDKSDILWHSMILLVENCKKVSGSVSVKYLNEICSGIKFIIVGSYDGEGFLFWEKT